MIKIAKYCKIYCFLLCKSILFCLLAADERRKPRIMACCYGDWRSDVMVCLLSCYDKREWDMCECQLVIYVYYKLQNE